jgi:uncharacterized protein YndB with AHSA1/START domain
LTEAQQYTVRIERTFDASADQVFDAWTSEEVLRRWFNPGPGWETPIAEVDLRAGGSVRVTGRRLDGAREYGASGQYIEIDRPRRLTFTWTFDDDPSNEQLIELDFSEQEGATTVTMVNSRISLAERRDDQQVGWSAFLDNLERELAR